MAFNNRREFLFVYTVKDANPNGDPLNANHPRYDDDSGQILVSDVRVKRTVRDQWLREGKDVFVDGKTKTLKDRVEELKSKLSVDNGREALSKCIDTRLFGATFALGKESFSWTGPVQFKWGRSLHQATVETIQGTAAFATKDTSEQRSLRNEYIVPFVMIADYAVANQYTSKETGATDQDLDSLFAALWKGTENLITRSKVGHMPRFLMEIKYASGFDGIMGALDEKICLRGNSGEELSEDQQRSLRACSEATLDLSDLEPQFKRLGEHIESVKIILDSSIQLSGLDGIADSLGGKLVLEKR